PRDELLQAIGAVMRDKLFFSEGIRHFLGQSAIEHLHQAGHLSVLTEQERRVLTLVAAGLSNKDVAQKLGVDKRTVESHRASLKKKLHINSVAGLTKFAL